MQLNQPEVKLSLYLNLLMMIKSRLVDVVNPFSFLHVKLYSHVIPFFLYMPYHYRLNNPNTLALNKR